MAWEQVEERVEEGGGEKGRKGGGRGRGKGKRKGVEEGVEERGGGRGGGKGWRKGVEEGVGERKEQCTSTVQMKMIPPCIFVSQQEIVLLRGNDGEARTVQCLPLRASTTAES